MEGQRGRVQQVALLLEAGDLQGQVGLLGRQLMHLTRGRGHFRLLQTQTQRGLGRGRVVGWLLRPAVQEVA